MPARRRLTAVEFGALVPLLKISDDRIAAARAALVDGRTLQAVGDQFGVSRQAVNQSIDVVWSTLGQYRQSQKAASNAGRSLPPGWEQVTLVAPSHLIEQFREQIAREAQASPAPAAATDNTTAAKPLGKPPAGRGKFS